MIYRVKSMVINKMKYFNKKIHEGKIIMFVEGVDPEKDDYDCGVYIEDFNILEKNGLKPGDIVKYQIVEGQEYFDCAKILTNKKL